MLFLYDKEKYKQQAKENAAQIMDKFSIQKHLKAISSVYFTLLK